MQLRDAAEAYCRLIDDAEALGRERFIREVARALVRLMSEAYDIREPEATDEEPLESISHDQWFVVFKRLQNVLNDPERADSIGETEIVEDHVNMVLLLPDALADVWRELRDGIDLLSRGSGEQEVLWEWWFGFYSHWDKHAAEALALLHQRISEAGSSLW